MALPTSGPLGINDIRNELGAPHGSLQMLSNIAGFSLPHKISDFYGYSSAIDVAYEFYISGDNAYLYVAYASGPINQFHELVIVADIRFRSPIWFYQDRIETRNFTFFSNNSVYQPQPIDPFVGPGFYYPLNTVEILAFGFIVNPQNINIVNMALIN